MAIAKNYPALSNENDVHLGDGHLFVGPANAAFNEATMKEFGCLRATATFTPIIMTAQLKTGSPRALTIVEPEEVGCQLKVTLVELNALRLAKVFGMGTTSTHTASTPTVTDEQVDLFQDVFHHLIYPDVSAIPAPVVTDGGGSPTVYVENTDYEIDYDNGLIRRLSTGSITDGRTVYVTYTYSRGAYKRLRMGVETDVDYYPLLFVVPRKSQKRGLIKIWKASPTEFGDLPFQNDDFTALDVTFSSIADRTKSPDDMFYRLEWDD